MRERQEVMGMAEQDLQKYFYQQEQSCPVCAEKFPATKVRKSMCAVDRRDTDFYNHCAPVDPNAYSVWVCPQCGYAASDANFADVTPVEKGLLQKALAGRPKPPDLTGQRDTALALQAMEQALFCAQARQGKPSVLAGLYLKTAWVLRAANDATETAYLEQALENYRQAYQSEALPLGKMSELTLTYLIGELSRRLGNLNEAVNWFYQVVNSPDAPREPQILNQAKEQWRLAREQAEQASNAAPGAAASPPREAASPPGAAVESAQATPPTAATPEQLVVPEPPTTPEVPAAPAPRAKVPTAISLYRDQVDWARRVANLCAGHNPRLDLAAVIRAALQAFQEIEPPELEAEDEAGLTAKLKQALTGKAV
ncbi:MAG: DUF2225 domain-containing protein [Symbiobacteriia bacterium]